MSNIVGTKNIDNVDNNEDYILVNALAGNDIIKNSGSSVSINAGNGNDKITLTGGDNITVYGGAGADTIWNYSDGGNVYQYANGSGKDVIIGYSEEDTIYVEDGKYTVSTSGNDRVIKIGSGSSNMVTLKNSADTIITLVDKYGNIDIFEPDPIPPDGWKYDAKKPMFQATITTPDDIDLNEPYGDDIKIIDASTSKNGLVITGNDLGNSIKGGKGNDTIISGEGDDTVSLGAGSDIFVYNGGDDLIQDYAAGKDLIKIDTDYIEFADAQTVGSNVILNTDKGTITVKNGKNKVITVVNEKGDTVFPEPIPTLPSGWNYSNSARTIIKSTVKSAKELDLTERYGKGVEKVDASNTTGIKITANDDGVSIKSSRYADTIISGDGNDTVSLGAGNDIFVYTGGDDLIQDYGTGNDKIYIDTADFDITSIETVKSDLVFTFNYGSGSVTIKNGKSKKITVTSDDGDTIYPYDPIPGWKYVDNKTLTATVATAVDLDLNKNYGYGITKIDSTKITGGVKIIANDEGDSIKTGRGNDTVISGAGNDTVSLGAGADIFVYNGGNDLIQDYAVADRIQINTDDISIDDVQTVSSDVIFSTNKGNITVKKGKGKVITIIDSYGDTIYPEPIPTLPSGWNYTNSTMTVVKAMLKSTATLDLTEKYGVAVKNVNATLATSGAKIICNDLGNSIKGSSGADTIISGAGNDTIALGNGSDIFIYTGGDDIITDFKTGSGSDSITFSNDVTIEAAETIGNDVVFTTNTGNLTLQKAKDKSIVIHNEDGDIIYPNEPVPPDGWKYNSLKTTLIATVRAADNLDLNENYGENVTTVDASFTNNGVEIIANDLGISIKGGLGNDTIISGEGGDTLIGGRGNDLFVYNGGDDFITDYNQYGKDIIKIDTDNLVFEKVETIGADVIYTTDYGALTVKDGKNKNIIVVDSDDQPLNFLSSSYDLIEDDNYITGTARLDEIIEPAEINYSMTDIQQTDFETFAQDKIVISKKD